MAWHPFQFQKKRNLKASEPFVKDICDLPHDTTLPRKFGGREIKC